MKGHLEGAPCCQILRGRKRSPWFFNRWTIHGRDDPPSTTQSRSVGWISLCWNSETSNATVDGWNPAPVEVGSLSHYLQGFLHPRWCRISAINSRMNETKPWSSKVSTEIHHRTLDVMKKNLRETIAVGNFGLMNYVLGGGLKYVVFHPYLGKWSNWLKSAPAQLKMSCCLPDQHGIKANAPQAQAILTAAQNCAKSKAAKAAKAKPNKAAKSDDDPVPGGEDGEASCVECSTAVEQCRSLVKFWVDE